MVSRVRVPPRRIMRKAEQGYTDVDDDGGDDNDDDV